MFTLLPSRFNERGPTAMAMVLAALHASSYGSARFSLEVRNYSGTVALSMDLPATLRSEFESKLLDVYPGMTIEPILSSEPDGVELNATVRLAPDFASLLNTAGSLGPMTKDAVDPLTGILSTLRMGRSGRVECELRIEIQQPKEKRIHAAHVSFIRSRRRFLSRRLQAFYVENASHPARILRLLAMAALLVSRREKRSSETCSKLIEPLFECFMEIRIYAPPDATDIAHRKIRDIVAALAPFASPESRFVASLPTKRKRRRRGRGFLLTPAELALLWHLPMESSRGVARLAVNPFKEIEPPIWLPAKERESGVTTLGRVRFRQQRERFGIRMDDLRRHLIAIGKTGCGKSTFLQNVVLQQIEAGRGVVLIDPHGQLVDDVIGHIPKRRTNDVILFDAGDREWTVPFNPLIGPPGADAGLVADGVLTAFQKVFGLDAGSAPRLLHIFRNCLLSLIGRPDASLMAIQRLLTDVNYRKTVTAQVTNPVVREFWLGEFGRWNERDRTQYIASLQNKLGAFTTNERLQRIFAPSKRGLNLRNVLDSSQILLCNLSKGTVGHDASTLLGSLLISSLQTAAMSRADIPEEERTDAVVVIDEFHSYLSPGNTTMADALAESRKYRTSYVLATQLLEQLDNATLAGVMGNCGSVLTMSVGPRDATVLSELLGKGLTPEDLMGIPKYHGYIRMLSDGMPSTFSMTTLPPPRNAPNRSEIIRKASRQRYGVRAV